MHGREIGTIAGGGDPQSFMLGVLGLGGAIIGITYIGVILRYLYPKGGSDTPPLKVALANTGITPDGAAEIAFKNGVAGPFYYPTTLDKSVVVGVFVEKKDKNGPLTTENILVAEQTCTHLGCPVTWTSPMRISFECPCHGSQFQSRPLRPQRPRGRAAARARVHAGREDQHDDDPEEEGIGVMARQAQLQPGDALGRRSAAHRRRCRGIAQAIPYPSHASAGLPGRGDAFHLPEPGDHRDHAGDVLQCLGGPTLQLRCQYRQGRRVDRLEEHLQISCTTFPPAR